MTNKQKRQERNKRYYTNNRADILKNRRLKYREQVMLKIKKPHGIDSSAWSMLIAEWEATEKLLCTIAENDVLWSGIEKDSDISALTNRSLEKNAPLIEYLTGEMVQNLKTRSNEAAG